MPTQKHKKKKKSHKLKKKKHVSNYNIDSDGFGPLKKLLNSGSESSENEEEITPLVRRSYVNHLEQALLQNFESCSNTSNFSSSLQEMANSWSSVLEKKALEASTISELYRKNMVSLIKHITVATSGRNLCIKGKHFAKLSAKLPLNKETQTESMDINNEGGNSSQFGLQKNTAMMSLFLNNTDGHIPSGNHSVDASSFLSFTPQKTVSHISKVQQVEPSSSNQDVISSTSDFFDPLPFNLKTDGLKNSCEILNRPVSPLSHQANISLSEQCKENFFSQLDDEVLLQSNDNCEPREQESSELSVEQSKIDTADKDCLDKRLHEMGIFNDSEEESNTKQSYVIISKKSNWYAEEVAQSCNFTRLLLGMSTNHQIRVLNKIKTIFGDEEDALSELTEKNITICRRRIASVVVMELTPIYQAKKIASRQLFKFLAKQITKSLLDQSYAPDTRVIRQTVKDFFRNGKVITCESDCC